MGPNTADPIDVNELRQKLVEAERKYYSNLTVLEEKLARLEAVQTLTKLLIPCTDPSDVLNNLTELSVKYMGVEKALVIRPTVDGYEIGANKGYSRRQSRALQQLLISGSSQHLTKVFRENTSSLFDTMEEGLTAELDLSQMIICPLASDEGVFFGFYVIGFSERKKNLFRPFDLTDVEFFHTIAVQVSALLENLNLRDSFKRFVPFEFLALLEKKSIQEVNPGDNVSLDMHVMFTDLRDFTLMSEGMGPARVFALLNEYLSVMAPQIASVNGFINQYQGDAIMALFSGEADGAVLAAIRMWDALHSLNEKRSTRQENPLRIGIGINSGQLLLGAIGSAERLDSNVVGDAPNLASRVESMTKVYGAKVLVSGSTYDYLSHSTEFTFRELDRVLVAGKTKPVELYELLDVDTGGLREQKEKSMARFAEGLNCYRAGKFRDARLLFAECLVNAPLDDAAALYVGRCAELVAHPPAGIWDGTTVIHGK